MSQNLLLVEKDEQARVRTRSLLPVRFVPLTGGSGVALLAAIGILAGASIAYEILLTRLLAILLWHHFAYMIISVALLGIGASGTFLAFARGMLTPRFTEAFAGCATVFAASAIGGFALAQRVQFNPLEVIWDPGQQLHLAQIYGLLALPFFAVGTAIGLAFIVYENRIAAIYAPT